MIHPTDVYSRRAARVMWLALLPVLGCSASDGDTSGEPLPSELHGLPLMESHAGEEAAEMIGRLHDKGVAPTESYIGYYGPENMRAVLYISQYGSEADARSQLELMATKIGDGSSGYAHHTKSTIGGLNVHSVLGHGQVHYFFADGNNLSWLATPPMLARPTLAQLLGVAVDSIPSMGPQPTG